MQSYSIEKEGETVDEAVQLALEEFETDIDSVEYEVLEEGDAESPTLVRTWRKTPAEVEDARQALSQTLKSLDLDAEIASVFNWEKDTLEVNIKSEDAGILIGRQGQTLDALQYLLQLMINSKDINVVLDIADYRERHRTHLVQVADGIAERVLRQRRRITLKPMDARDRKIVHEAVKPFPELSSSSVGVEPNRRVVVSLRRADYNNNSDRHSSRGGRHRQGGRGRYRN